MTAYTTAAQIGAALGVTLTPEQAAQADQLAIAITMFIDRYTGRSWQAVSPISAEVVPVQLAAPHDRWANSARAFLAHRPAIAVTAVGLRTLWPNAAQSPLDPTAYELVDPTNGVLLLPGYGLAYGYYAPWFGLEVVAVVDYSYGDAVPADITLAATMIGSGAMAKLIAVQNASKLLESQPELAGLKSISVGQNDVNLSLADPGGSLASSVSESGSGWAQPGSAVAMILNGYRRVVIA